jgi:hypothetical protein
MSGELEGSKGFMVMSQLSPHRGRLFPPQQVQRRQQRREALQHRLRHGLVEYLDAVAVAVRTLGFALRGVALGPGPDLDATITVGRGPDPTREGGQPEVPEELELAWAEDTGWSVTHPGLQTAPGTVESVTRYLHLDLVPTADTVAGFLVAVLLDGGDVGMPYPAGFRLRSQPLQPVLDALDRHTHPASPTPSTTPSLTTPSPSGSPRSPAYAAAV